MSTRTKKLEYAEALYVCILKVELSRDYFDVFTDTYCEKGSEPDCRRCEVQRKFKWVLKEGGAHEVKEAA